MFITLLAVGMRGAGLVFRFSLTIFLAKVFGLEALGIVGIITACVAMAPAAFSFGLHYRLNREIVLIPLEEGISHTRDRIILHVVVICVLSLIGLFAVEQYAAVRSLQILYLLAFFVAVLEIISNEIYLGLIALGRPLTSNVFLFIRSSAWIPIFTSLAFFVPWLRSIEFMMTSWLCGIVVAYIILLAALRDWPWRKVWCQRTQFLWLFKGFDRSIFIYLSDISMTLAQFGDRFIVGLLIGVTQSGIYVFYWSVATGIQQLVTTSVVQVALPELVSAASQNDNNMQLRNCLIRNLRRVLWWALAIGTGAFAAIHLLLPYLGKAQLTEYRYLFPILIVGALIRLLSDTLNYGIYAMRKDNALALTNMISVIVTISLSALGGWFWLLPGVAIAFVCASVIVFGFRVFYLRELIPTCID